jgi:hypothetical protein
MAWLAGMATVLAPWTGGPPEILWRSAPLALNGASRTDQLIFAIMLAAALTSSMELKLSMGIFFIISI